MDETSPKSIGRIGLTVAILSSLIIFCSSIGLVIFNISSLNKEINNFTIAEDAISGIKILFFVVKHYVEMFLITISLGMCFLIGGINIRKYKLWANRLISFLSLILLCIIWFFMITFFSIFSPSSALYILGYVAILNAIFWSILLIFLIRFLSSKKIEMHFV